MIKDRAVLQLFLIKYYIKDIIYTKMNSFFIRSKYNFNLSFDHLPDSMRAHIAFPFDEVAA